MSGSSVGPSTPQFQELLSSAAIAVVLAVGLVVLVVVADEVLQGEAVVAGDEIDAGIGLPAARMRRDRWNPLSRRGEFV